MTLDRDFRGVISSHSAIVLLRGGLGNQLYQLAYAVALLKSGAYRKVFVDHRSGFFRDSKYGRAFCRLPLSDLGLSTAGRFRAYWGKASHRMGLSCLSATYLDGYYHDVRHVTESLGIMRPVLYEAFGINPFQHQNNVLHIRRYPGIELFCKDTEYWAAYFKRSVRKANVGGETGRGWRVVSDDYAWAKAWLGQNLPNFVDYELGCEEGLEETDFRLMVEARNLVISPSTYSIWAAYLCQGKVFAPSWYAEPRHQISWTPDLLYESHWELV